MNIFIKIKESLIIKIIFVAILFLSNLSIIPTLTYAARDDSYTVLTPLPGIGDTTGKTDLATYIPALFKLAIGISIAFVLINLVIGGFQYMSSDAFQKKDDGKKRIENAIKGLFLVLGAWLILNTINPNLLEINLNIDTITTNQNGGTIVATTPPTGGATGTGTVCFNCQKMADSGLTLSSNVANWCTSRSDGCLLNQDIVKKLQNLNSEVNGLTLTEIWPPSRVHNAACHQNGTCVDAVFQDQSSVSSIKDFINKAIKNNLRPVFESSDPVIIDELKKSGVSSGNLLLYPKCSATQNTNCITGTHFSLYN